MTPADPEPDVGFGTPNSPPGGEMGRLVRDLDWAVGPLGPIAGWSTSLRAIVALLLDHPLPSIVLWGPQLVQIYNDGYARIAAGKHPAGLGMPTRECWPEVWHINGPIYERVLAGGGPVVLQDQLFPIVRNGEMEDAHFTLSYSAARGDSNRVEGVLLTIVETTARVEAERNRARHDAERCRVEAALRASEKLRHIAVESGGMGTWTWDAKNDRIRGDAVFMGLYGFPPSDAPSPLARFTARMAPEAAAACEAVAARELTPGEEFDGNLALAFGPTAGSWVRWRGRVDRDDPSIINGVSFDVTGPRRAEERQAFLLGLSDALRPLSDPVAIQEAAMRVLGGHLKVGRAFYGELQADGDTLFIGPGYSRALPPLEGWVRFSDFDSDMVETYRAGRTVVLDDVRVGAQFTARALAGFEAIGVRAAVGVPLVKDGRVRAIVSLHQSKPRGWMPAEVALAEETAERTWAAAERARAEAALRASEGRLRAVAESLPNAALFVVDADLRYTLAAGEAMEAAGFTPDAIEGRTVREAMDADLTAEYEANFRRALAGEAFRVEHSSHGRRYITHGTPLRDAAGSVVAALAVSYDITDRKAAEDSLRQAEERLRLALSAARMGTWAWDVAADAHRRDASLNALLGLPAEETVLPLDDFLSRLHADDRGDARAAFDRSARRSLPLDAEFRVIRPDGSVRWLRDQGDFFGAPGGARMIGACVDISELKAAEAALQRANGDLEARVEERTGELAAALGSLESEMGRRRGLARQLSTAQEDERRRVSRDLHDTVGQLMAGLALSLRAAERAGELPAAAAGRLAEAGRLLDELGREVHGLAVRLRPTSLDDLGLEPALGQLVAEWSARSGVRAGFQSSGLGPGRLPAEIETAIYRAVQESLTNVAKHAAARVVGVVVSRPDGYASAVIEDDGAGFDPESSPAGRLGLVGMRERVALVGGTIEVESSPGSGTTIYVRIPVPEG